VKTFENSINAKKFINNCIFFTSHLNSEHFQLSFDMHIVNFDKKSLIFKICCAKNRYFSYGTGQDLSFFQSFRAMLLGSF